MLNIISANLSGSLPDPPTLLAVREALQKCADVYRPTADGLKHQMETATNLDVSVCVLIDVLLARQLCRRALSVCSQPLCHHIARRMRSVCLSICACDVHGACRWVCGASLWPN